MPNKLDIRGVIPPIITAFDRRGMVDEEAQRDVVSFLLKHVQGFYVCGTYGSGPLMDIEQRKRCAEIVVDEVNGKVPVIIHIGTTSTSACIELGKHAEEIGATAVASVPPYYYRHREEDVKFHFQKLLDSIGLPVYFYNNPKTTGFSTSAQFLKELSDIGVKGVKDSSFNILTFCEFLRAIKKEDFNFIIGTEALLLPAVSMGARGCISGLANAIPEPVVELFKAAEEGNMKRAGPLQEKVLILRDIMHYGPTIPVVHAILKERGINPGYPKAPFQEISKDLRERVLKDIEKYFVLT